MIRHWDFRFPCLPLIRRRFAARLREMIEGEALPFCGGVFLSGTDVDIMAFPDSHLPPDEAARPLEDVERYGHLIQVKPEYRERYVVLHAHPFPELIEQMRAAGLRNYSIFLRDHTLFSYYEYVGADFEADMEAMAEHETVQDWWTLTDSMQEPLDARAEGEWWASMGELYHGGRRAVLAAEATRVAFEHSYREGAIDEVEEAYAETDGELEAELDEAHVQRYTVYRLGRRCFTYLEHAGDDLEADLRDLRERPAMRRLQSALSAQRASPAKETPSPRMESVFFMA